MTLLYSPLHSQYDRTCTEHFIASPIPRPSSAASNTERTYADSIPRPHSAEHPSARKNSIPSNHDGNPHLYRDVGDKGPRIIAPYPKKALCAGLRLLSGFGSEEKLVNIKRAVERESMKLYGGLKNESEDAGSLGHEKMTPEALAFAELKEIIATSSRDSSRPVSQSASPTHARAVSPPNVSDNEGSEYDDEDAMAHMSYSTSAIEIRQPKNHNIEGNHFEALRPTALQRLTVDYSHLMFGSSPITRANNPLPLDESFSPDQRFPVSSNPKRSSFTYMHKKMSTGDLNAPYDDESLNIDKHGNIADNGVTVPFSKGSRAAILLSLSEGGRRRSLSVGSVNFKPEIKPRSVC
ncbi:4751_t:CDS:2 [Paraglomus occultum]|uniref:4751_t:CDS:1 n=1 Tax=Paraglomus occultum TaxID=144539 RepID=A0A9N8ZVD6_9GLOM|nr:4751_t:CDS:2 [Paraglomus occultum]